MSSEVPPPIEGDDLLDEVMGPQTLSPHGSGQALVPEPNVSDVVPERDLLAEAPPAEAAEATPDQQSLGNAEDLVDESAGAVPQAEQLPAKEFQPWHKPRKQFLREVQWCEAIGGLIEELGLGARGRPLGYLSLPGDELLDVRAVHKHCHARGVQLRFLGYNAIAEEPQRVTESRLSETEVRSLPNIYAPSSTVLHDALEDVALASTMAHKEARQHAPYDVINIDLCNGMLNAKPQTRRSTLQAVRALVEIQLSAAGSPWLFFLTTRIGRSLLDEDAQTLLHGRVLQNTSQAAFCSAMLRDLGLSRQNVADECARAHPLPDPLLQKALSLGVCKWLLGLVMASNAGWRATLLPSYSYQIGPKHPQDMVSFGFRVERNLAPLNDPSALTVPVASAPPPMTEQELALALVEEVAHIGDLDAKLTNDKALFERMVHSHGELLAQARYEKDKYLQWVADGYPR